MIADYDHKELSEDGFNPKHPIIFEYLFCLKKAV